MANKSFFRSLAFASCLFGMAAQAQAQTIGFLDPNLPACFSRDYDAAHLRANPGQRVAGIALMYAPRRGYDGGETATQWDSQNDDPNFNATLAVKLVGQAATYYTGVNCRVSEGSVRCVIDEDGGAFTLSLTEGGLRLQNENGFTVAPMTGDERREAAATVRIRADAAHRTFLIPGGADRACRRGWALPY